MNMTLERTDFEADGILGILLDDKDFFVAHTLEHAYGTGAGDGSYTPKVPVGTYTCKRSPHRLHGMSVTFETFQLMDVPNHSNILLHWGNFNKDSDGCILLGQEVTTGPKGEHMITNSRATFVKFMDLQDGVDTFTLTVK